MPPHEPPRVYVLDPDNNESNHAEYEHVSFEDDGYLHEHREVLIDWDGSPRRRDQPPPVTPEDLCSWGSSNSIRLSSQAITLKSGMDIELCGGVFLRIYDIVTNFANSRRYLRGHIFLRNGQQLSSAAKRLLYYEEDDISSFLMEYPNEVHMSIHLVDKAAYALSNQSLRMFPIECFKRLRSIIFTNQLYPAFNQSVSRVESRYHERPDDILVCRWITSKTWKTAKDRETHTVTHCRKQIRRISEGESHRTYVVADSELLLNFRGETIKGGDAYGIPAKEYCRHQEDEKRLQEARSLFSQSNHVDLTEDTASPGSYAQWINAERYSELEDADALTNGSPDNDDFWKRTWQRKRAMRWPQLQRYSMADFFCGCGGATIAAKKAGFFVKYAVDKEREMCETYLLNNPAARVACADVRDFASQRYVYDKKVDIIHLSPPCQPVSRPHTTTGKNDKVNLEALGNVEAVLEVARPRIVTLEQADALGTFEKHFEYLRQIVRQLIVMDFSVDFQIVQLADYGLCQKRLRLVLIAACPGQRLPGFPKKTHRDPNAPSISTLSSWVSFANALAEIPHKWTLHNPADVKLLYQGEEAEPGRLCNTVITNNGKLPHPCGWRHCTIREILVGQGFPLHFEFPKEQSEATIRRQIGNAVPPVAFEVICRHIQRELLKDDGMLDKNGMRKPDERSWKSRRPITAFEIE